MPPRLDIIYRLLNGYYNLTLNRSLTYKNDLSMSFTSHISSDLEPF